MKRVLNISALIAILAFPLLGQSDDNVAFKWAFGALTGKEETFVTITRDTLLHSGDDIKMLVTLEKMCYVYVIYESPNGEITMLFPYSLGQFSNDYETGKNYYIPKGRTWIPFDKSTGKEKFYLLAANERLTDLEGLVRKYEGGDKTVRPDLSKKIISEIRDVKRKFRTFATIAEKPVTIGGNIRGIGEAETVSGRRPDVATIATMITASNFYSKTITIDHR